MIHSHAQVCSCKQIKTKYNRDKSAKRYFIGTFQSTHIKLDRTRSGFNRSSILCAYIYENLPAKLQHMF